MSCKTFMITSCKGGVGKSTIASNLALFLAKEGKKVLLVDCDFGNRSLDLILGVQNEVVFDLGDVMLKGIDPAKAIMKIPGSDTLWFLPAPYQIEDDAFTPKAFRDTLRAIAEKMGLDRIIIDTPGDIGYSFRIACAASDSAIVVSTCTPTSIRAAERTGERLSTSGIESSRLVINCYDAEHLPKDGTVSVLTVIDQSYLQLLAILPNEPKVTEYQTLSRSVLELPKTDVYTAYTNMVNRLGGMQVPLFTGFKKESRQKLMKQIRQI